MSNELTKVYNTALSRFRGRLSKREISEGLNYDYIHDAVEEIIRKPDGFNSSENKIGYMLSIARNIRSKKFNTDISKGKPVYESFVSPFSDFNQISTADGIETSSVELSLEDGSGGFFVDEDHIYDKIILKDVAKWLNSDEDQYVKYNTFVHGKPKEVVKIVKPGMRKALRMSIEGYSRSEISSKMNINMDKVKYLLASGKKELNSKFLKDV